MSDDIIRAIDWVGCTTNSPSHTEEIRSDALRTLATLRETLSFYANIMNHRTGIILHDEGLRARQVLNQKEPSHD